MNRDGIDFTKKKRCCVCGAENSLSAVMIGKFGEYTRCKALICEDCASLCCAEKGKDGKYSVESVDMVPGLVKKEADKARAEMKKAVAAVVAKRPRLARWTTSPFSVEGGATFSEVAMASWVESKEDAFRQKIRLMGFFWELKHVPCPVCGKEVALTTKGDVEINTNLEFACPDGHLAFDEAELNELFSAKHSYYAKNVRCGKTTWGWEQREREMSSPEFLFCSAYGFLQVQKALQALWIDKWDLVKDFMQGVGACGKCKYRSDKCRECRTKFAEERPESWARYKLAYAFPERMNLRGLFETIAEAKKYKASKHCRMWCATSPDNGATRICGATGEACGFDGEKPCRLCEKQIDGAPVGNFLATVAMCQHYKNGQCLACRGKDNKWKGERNLPTCTFKATDFIYSDKGTFCESYCMRKGIDLDAAASASAEGTSYSGYWR